MLKQEVKSQGGKRKSQTPGWDPRDKLRVPHSTVSLASLTSELSPVLREHYTEEGQADAETSHA